MDGARFMHLHDRREELVEDMEEQLDVRFVTLAGYPCP